jgi:hypothetical protein
MPEGKTGFRSRHDDFTELDVTGRAPREHARGAGASESGHRVAADSSRGLGIAGAELNNTAAVGWTAKNFVARTEPIQDLQAEERDVRCLQHVATQIHDDFGCRPAVSAC